MSRRVIEAIFLAAVFLVFVYLSGIVTTKANVSNDKDFDWRIITTPNVSIIDKTYAPSETQKGDISFLKTRKNPN